MKAALPKYRRQKQSNGPDRAFVEVGPRRVYLGAFNSPASKRKYARLVAELAAHGGVPPSDPEQLTVAEIADRFLTYAETYYRRPNVETTSEVTCCEAALKVAVEIYGDLPASKMGPLALKVVRDAMIRKGWARTHINSQISRIKRAWRWATENELIKADAWHAMQSVSGLRRGRSEAKESVPVRPVPEHVVEETIKHLTPTLTAMVRVQALTGMRAGELVIMRVADLDMSGPTWLYSPATHKTAYLGRPRVIPLGPRAQDLIRPYLTTETEAFLFTPRRSERERYDGCTTHRRPDQKPNERKTTRELGERYDSRSYHQAIRTACRKAFPEPKGLTPEQRREFRKANWWHPHQLRHALATKVRREFGLEQTQAVLGHANAKVSELYAESDKQLAVEVARRIG